MTDNTSVFFKPEIRDRAAIRKRPVELWKSLSAHKIMVSSILAIGFAVSVPAVLSLAPVYVAQAVIEVSPRFAQIFRDDKDSEFPSDTLYQQFLRQQVVMMTRHDILTDALGRLGSRRSLWQKKNETDQHAAERLAAKLKVFPIADTYSIKIGLEGGRPEGLAEIVNTVVEAYLAKEKVEQIFGSEARFTRLKEYRGELTKNLQEKESHLAQAAQKMGPVAYSIAVDPEAVSKSHLIQRREELLGSVQGLARENPVRKGTELQIKEIEKTIAQTYPSPSEKVHVMSLKQQSDSIRKKLDSIDDALSLFALGPNRPELVKLVSPAHTPDSAKMKKIFFLLFFGGTLALSVFIPVLADSLDTKIHNAGDLEEILGFPTLGWLPDTGDRQKGHLIGDQFKRLAFAIERARRENGFKVFLLTSVTAGDGITSLTLGLAYELKALGIKAIAVEANPLNHDRHYPDQSIQRPGLINVIPKRKSIGTAMVPLSQKNNDEDPILIETANGRQWLSSAGGASEAFNDLKSNYDVILLDSPPLLQCAETEHLVGIADATLLVVRADKTNREQVIRTTTRLEQLSPAAVGAIVNRVGFKNQTVSVP